MRMICSLGMCSNFQKKKKTYEKVVNRYNIWEDAAAQANF